MATQNKTKKKRKVRKDTRGWFARLFDMDDSTVSASTVFLMITSITATILLLVPAIVLLVEIFTMHTITTSLSGMAAYIASVAGLYAAGGILKGWTNYSTYRYHQTGGKTALLDFVSDDEETEEDDSDDEYIAYGTETDEPELDA